MRLKLQVFLTLAIAVFGCLEASAQSAPKPKLLFNHLYVVLDKATFDDLLESKFFPTNFASVDSGMPGFLSTDQSSNSLYVRGCNTYLELLGPDNSFNEPVGKIGLGFSVEQPGALNLVESLLQDRKIEMGRFSQEWSKGFPEPVDWFESVTIKASKDSAFVWWISEYSPEFLKALYPGRPRLHGKIDRQSFLKPIYSQEKVLKNVVSISLCLRSVERQPFADGLTALGFRRSEVENETHLNSSDLSVVLKEPADFTGPRNLLASIGFSTNSGTRPFAEFIGPGFAIHVDRNGNGKIALESPEGIVRHRNAVPRSDCFPIDQLPAELQSLSKELLLDALDSEALYTFVGDLKPVSEGFFDRYIEAPKSAAFAELEKIEKALSAWTCGECFEAGVLPFDRLHDGKRYLSAWVSKRDGLAQKIRQESTFFGQLGLTPNTTTKAALLTIERASSREERWRGFGYLFGYPDFAIDFFVRAGMHQRTTGEFVERDFRNFPTHDRTTGGFVYAIPKLTPETDSEKNTRQQTDAILTQYRALREQKIVDECPDHVVELIRDLFDDGTGWCHPSHALQKTATCADAR